MPEALGGTSGAERPGRILVIESARGAAASYVVLAHFLQLLGLRANGANSPLWLDLLGGYAHQAVLFFFLLSGFSIHYASAGRPLDSPAGILHYYYLRLRRIYPILLLILAFSCSLMFAGAVMELPGYAQMWQATSVSQVVQNLLLVADLPYVCGRWADVIGNVGQVWSLAYEIAYYAIYPLFWLLARRYSIVFSVGVGCALSLLAGWASRWHCDHIFNVLGLYFAWCLGAGVADLRLKKSRVPMPRWLFYMGIYCLLQMIPVISETSLSFLLEAFWIILFALLMLYPISNASQQILEKPQKLMLLVIVVLIAAAVLVAGRYWPLAHNPALLHERALFIAALWCAILLLDGVPVARDLLKVLISKLAPIGAISYALYLLHMPLMHFARALASQGISLVFMMLMAVTLSVVLAHWMELRYQPLVSAWLDLKLGRRFRSGVVPA